MQSIKHIPPYGTHRTVTKFLWWPKRIDSAEYNESRTVRRRWLELATWEEKWTKDTAWDYWKNVRWID